MAFAPALLATVMAATSVTWLTATSADMAKFVVTFRDVIWTATEDNAAAYVDGTGSDVAWFIDGGMKLGCYDARIQQKLETRTVSSSHGNGALNAKLLGAPYN